MKGLQQSKEHLLEKNDPISVRTANLGCLYPIPLFPALDQQLLLAATRTDTTGWELPKSSP